ncbi:hypothetical protein V2J09_013830 [Rumex salicifolius]
MRTWRGGRRQDLLMQRRDPGIWRRLRASIRRRSYRTLIIMLFLMAIVPPLYFHSKLRRLNQEQVKKCGWIRNPPLVCAHGGDSTYAFPNTVAAYLNAIRSRVDCIEIDVSRSSDGFLFALHDSFCFGHVKIDVDTGRLESSMDLFFPDTGRDMQRMAGNDIAKVGHLSKSEIHEMDSQYQFRLKLQDQQVSTIEEALMLVSRSVRQVILDVKVGPPLYEKGLAESILSVLKRTQCTNCIIWAKSDNIVRDVIRLSPNTTAGYIVMKDGHSGTRSYLTRITKAGVAGVYHPLIDENLIRVLHGRNKKVYAWTVDDAASMENMLSKQVDGVVTSNPTLFQQMMQDVKTQCVDDGF